MMVDGMRTTSSAASANVMLCPIVNAVTRIRTFRHCSNR